MKKDICEKLYKEYEALRDIKDGFDREAAAGILPGRGILGDKADRIYEKIIALIKERDPDQLVLRQGLAKRLGLDYVRGFHNGLAVVSKKDGEKYKYNYVNKYGRIISDKWFDDAYDIYDGYADVYFFKGEENAEICVINERGEIVLRDIVYFGGFSEGFATVEINEGEYRIVDKDMEFINEEAYEHAGSFSEGVCPVKLNGKWLYIDKSGENIFENMDTAISEDFEGAGDFKEGLAPVKLGTVWNYIDKSGQILIRGDYAEASSFSEGRAAVKKGPGWHYIDRSGNPLSGHNFDGCGDFCEDRAIAYSRVAGTTDERIYSFINERGEPLTRDKYDDIEPIKNGVGMSKKDGKWFYINKRGGKIINRGFVEAHLPKEGMALVKESKDGLYYYLNKYWVPAIKKGFREAAEFEDGVAWVKDTKGEEYLINKKGERVFD